MYTFTVYADIGNVKIRCGNAGIFLNNGAGDGTYKVYVHDYKVKIPDEHRKCHYAGYFEIYADGEGELMRHDCGESIVLHEFGPGRYIAYHDNNGNVHIYKVY